MLDKAELDAMPEDEREAWLADDRADEGFGLAGFGPGGISWLDLLEAE